MRRIVYVERVEDVDAWKRKRLEKETVFQRYAP